MLRIFESSFFLNRSSRKTLTSHPPLKQTVLGVFDFAEIIARGSTNFYNLNLQMDGFCFKCIAKLIGENRNRLAIVVWDILYIEKLCGVVKILTFSVFMQQLNSRQLLHLKII